MDRIVQYLLVENLTLDVSEREEFFATFRGKAPLPASENQPHRLLSERPNLALSARIFKAAFLPSDLLPVRIEVDLALIIGDPPPTVTHREEATPYGNLAIFQNAEDLASVLYLTDAASARAYVRDNDIDWTSPD